MAAATLTTISGLQALLVPEKDSIDVNENRKEAKKFELAPDGLSVGQEQPDFDIEAVQETIEADSDAINDVAEDGKIRPPLKLEDSRKQSGLKPPRSRENKCSDFDSSRFREDLERGIAVESSDQRSKSKRNVFGFGLSDEQQDALYQYIEQKKSGKKTSHEPDREALSECWGSPEPEKEDCEQNKEEISVVFSADLTQTLPAEERSMASLPVSFVPEDSETAFNNGREAYEHCGGKEELVNTDASDASIDTGKDADFESTESLYEGEGGVALGSRSGDPDAEDRSILDHGIGRSSIDEEKNMDLLDPSTGELLDRLHIMRKVRECYGLGVKTSFERVMGKEDSKPTLIRKDAHKPISVDEARQAVGSTMLDKEQRNMGSAINCDSIASPAVEIAEDETCTAIWEDECMRYLERSPEFRARLQYEVRVILISPAFRMAGGTVPAFSRLYEKKFGKRVESVGFSTAARLCRSMPHVVQRASLIDEGRLQLVDTPRNQRIVAGIRSGLRRIVYDILRSHREMDLEGMQEHCERIIGQSLGEVLIDHGYHTASVECMLRDMPDIAYLSEHVPETRVYLSNGAEDPAQTDGLLMRQPSHERCFVGMPGEKNKIDRGELSRYYTELIGDKNLQLPVDLDPAAELVTTPEGPRKGPNGMAPEELSDLRVLCAAESSNPYRDASIYNVEDVSPHVRLRFRLLLALHDDGRGVKVEALPSVYEKMFSVPLDLPGLGFDSVQELIEAWRDVTLLKNSHPGWAFPVNTLENNRILNTITSGLRSAVFAILLARYPEGLEPLELVECLQETLSGKLWEILSSNGFMFKDLTRTGDALSKGSSDFQLADCPELRLLLKDMEDFVRLGCRENGALIVKLRDGEFPLLDLHDCEGASENTIIEAAETNLVDDTTNNKEEQADEFTGACVTNRVQPATDFSQRLVTEPYDDVIMAMDIQVPSTILSEEGDSEAVRKKDEFHIHELDSSSSTNESPKFFKSQVVPSKASFKGDYSKSLGTASQKKPLLPSPPESPLPVSELMVAPENATPAHKLKHETRLILGSTEYMEGGLTVDEFCTIYRERTGRPVPLDGYKSVESLLHAMPDIVSSELPSASGDELIALVQNRRNMRVLSISKVGLRQVLFWALLKNPGGVWAELLEGWYLDFTGWPLSSALASHGYEKPRRAPLQSVMQFLEDMADVLEVDEDDSSLYLWAGVYEDPILADAALLGLPVETIQYDPVKEEYDNTHWHTGLNTAKAAQLTEESGNQAVDIDVNLVKTSSKNKVAEDDLLTTKIVSELDLGHLDHCKACNEDVDSTLQKLRGKTVMMKISNGEDNDADICDSLANLAAQC